MRATFRLLALVSSNTPSAWPSLQAQLDAVRAFYAPVCDLQIDIEPFFQIPMYDQNVAGVTPLSVINQAWFDTNVAVPYGSEADIILLIVRPTTTTPYGYMNANNVGPIETTVFVHGSETDRTYVNGSDYGPTLTHYACHELAHAFYRLVGKHDDTHVHFPVGQVPYTDRPENVLADFDFSSTSARLQMLKNRLISILYTISLLRKRQVVQSV